MVDVVVRLNVEAGEEAQLFGVYLNRFMESHSFEADRFADAPYLMIHTDPLGEVEVKVLTFQQRTAAQAFTAGWTQARNGLRSEIA